MKSSLDAAGLLSGLPVGVEPGSDMTSIVTGRLIGVDASQRAVQVSVLGSEPVWVPALPAIYPAGGTVRLLRSPLDGGRVSICLGPTAAPPPIARGEVVSVNAGVGTLTVTILGVNYDLPYNASTYSEGQFVHVLRDPQDFGSPYLVVGPEGNFTPPPPPDAGGGAANPGRIEARQVTIGPQWSGSYGGGRWDNWNANRNDYGGRSALYQGQGYGSPAMQGLAVYGDQIVNLHAESITRMSVHLDRVPAGSGGGTGPAVLQGSPHGGATPGGGPAPGGPTAAVGIERGTGVDFVLPSSMYDGFRTGTSKGLALVGGAYLNLYGTAKAGAMALTIQYTVIR